MGKKYCLKIGNKFKSSTSICKFNWKQFILNFYKKSKKLVVIENSKKSVLKVGYRFKFNLIEVKIFAIFIKKLKN